MADDKVKLRVEADASQAKAELESVDEAIGNLEETAQDAASPGGGLGSLVGRLTDLAGKGIAVATAFTLAYSKTREVIDGLKDFGVDVDKSTRGWADWVAGVDEAERALGSFATAFDKANVAVEAAKGARQKFLENLADTRKELAANAQAIADQMREIAGTTGVADKAFQDWVKKTLDGYEKLGDVVPDYLAKNAELLGVVSTAQARAAEESRKAAEQAEKDAEREEAAAARKAKAAEDASKRQIKAIQEAMAEARKELAQAEEAYQESTQIDGGDVTKLKSDLDELIRKQNEAGLSAEELKKRFDLEDAIRSQERMAKSSDKMREQLEREDAAYEKLRIARQRAEQAEYLATEQKLRSIRANEQLVEATEALGESAASVPTQWDPVTRTLQNTLGVVENVADGFEESSVQLEQVDGQWRMVSKTAATFNDEITVTADKVPEATKAIDGLGESAEKGQAGMDGMATAAERTVVAFEKMPPLLREIKSLTDQLRLGGEA